MADQDIEQTADKAAGVTVPAGAVQIATNLLVADNWMEDAADAWEIANVVLAAAAPLIVADHQEWARQVVADLCDECQADLERLTTERDAALFVANDLRDNLNRIEEHRDALLKQPTPQEVAVSAELIRDEVVLRLTAERDAAVARIVAARQVTFDHQNDAGQVSGNLVRAALADPGAGR